MGYILKYDNEIFSDISVSDSKDFISCFPNMERKLDKGLILLVNSTKVVSYY